jgi:Holliday junction resolvase
MTEENITREAVRYLQHNGWVILSFDYPQSGTGYVLRPNESCSRNKATIIPDIIAHNNDSCVFFENKVKFSENDYLKLKRLKLTNEYSKALDKVLSITGEKRVCIGIGLHDSKANIKFLLNHPDLDYRLLVDGTRVREL